MTGIRQTFAHIAGAPQGARATAVHPRGGLMPPTHPHLLAQAPAVPAQPSAAEGALLQRLQSSRLNGQPLWWNRSIDDAQGAVQLLHTGTRMPNAEVGAVGAELVQDGGKVVSGNFRGKLAVEWIENGGVATQAVVKPASREAYREVLTGRVARAVGLDHLVPASAMDAVGTTRIEFRPGRTAKELGVTSSDALEQHLARGYAARLGGGHDHVASRLARFDAQSMRFLDYVLGNRDRNAGNVLLHDDGTATFIDHEFIGWVPDATQNVLRPPGRELSLARGAKLEFVDDDVITHMRRYLTPDALRGMAAELGVRQGHPRLEGMIARLAHATQNGRLEWSRPRHTVNHGG